MNREHLMDGTEREGDPVGSPDPKFGIWAGERTKKVGREQSADFERLVDFLGLVLDNVYSGIIVCDLHCRIVYMNKVYAELLQIDRHKAVGKPIQNYFPRSQLARVMATGKSELGQRCSLKTDTTLLVNRIPLKHRGQTTGIILQTVFRDYKSFTDLVSRLNLLEHEVKYQKQVLDGVFSPRYSFDSVIGQSSAIEKTKLLSLKYARTEAPVLIQGATGTGKELFAHAVHAASNRSSGPFVCLSCAGIPRELLESELFGYESGAFTGARKGGKPGQIELAHRGTLFLDEIGELPINAQAKLLRVLEHKLLDKVGGVKPFQVDFRLVAATHRDLREMISRGEFRKDLYYRLNTLVIQIPSLSKRPEDIPILIRHFLTALDMPNVRVTDEALMILKSFSWPGNVRELKNTIERALSLGDGDIIDVTHLPRELLGLTGGFAKLSETSDSLLADEVARCEKDVLTRAINLNRGNMSKAARMLGISRSTLYEKCRRYGVVPAP